MRSSFNLGWGFVLQVLVVLDTTAQYALPFGGDPATQSFPLLLLACSLAPTVLFPFPVELVQYCIVVCILPSRHCGRRTTPSLLVYLVRHLEGVAH